MTDCITSMEEAKWDEMASLYLVKYLTDRGVVITVKEDHTLNELDDLRAPSEGARPETPPSALSRHGSQQS